ncbi:MAG: hypothetical protein LBR81_02770 [Prevotellaceae bacterium]|nr:hypothetical protein [Prevotellaceae bacterium]
MNCLIPRMTRRATTGKGNNGKTNNGASLRRGLTKQSKTLSVIARRNDEAISAQEMN